MAYDIVAARIEAAATAGAEAAISVSEVARQCKLIITMLPNGPEVEEVVLGTGGLLEAAQAGAVLVDMSSIAPDIAQKIHAACAEKGVAMLDAPVSGGEPKAIDGTLSIMVGGCEAVFHQVYDILMAMGASTVYCGGIGAGNTAKLANQIIVALNIAAVCEAFTLSTRAGVAPDKVFAAIRGGLAGSTVMNAKVPMILDDNFNPGFKLALHIKDLTNALHTGHALGISLPFTAQITEIMHLLSAQGLDQKDHCIIAKYYEDLTGTEIRG